MSKAGNRVIGFDADRDAPFEPMEIRIGGRDYSIVVSTKTFMDSVDTLGKGDHIGALATLLGEDPEVVEDFPINQVFACIRFIHQGVRGNISGKKQEGSDSEDAPESQDPSPDSTPS